MGCDGGTIPKRKEIVKSKGSKPKEERDGGASAAERWKNCSICDWVLKKPIVAGHLGHMFDKECVLLYLINCKRKSSQAHSLKMEKRPKLDSLHKMKNIKEIKLKANLNSNGDQASDSRDESIKADFVCPVTGLETNGKYKFVFSWNCGCVVSERALKEVQNDEKCLVCQTPYKPCDIIILNPDEEDFKKNKAAYLIRKVDNHSDTKTKRPNSEEDKLAMPLNGDHPTTSHRHLPFEVQKDHQDSDRNNEASTSRGEPSRNRESNSRTEQRRHRDHREDGGSSHSQLKKRKSDTLVI